MRPGMRIYALVTFGALLSATAPADAGMVERFVAKRQAKQEWKQLLKGNRGLAIHRRGELGLKSFGIKAATGVVAGTVEGAAVLDWFGKAMNGYGGGDSLVVGTIAALGVGVGGWKLAGAIKRGANTRTVEHALASGHTIPAAQLARWRSAGVIGELSPAAR